MNPGWSLPVYIRDYVSEFHGVKINRYRSKRSGCWRLVSYELHKRKRLDISPQRVGDGRKLGRFVFTITGGNNINGNLFIGDKQE